ncbi:hypothetical protein ACOZDE_18700 [Streptomyces griseoincarnatus]
MSGCCGQGPVIVSGAAAAPRLDVETVVLCDVLPDGTVAGIALVEPIYDTNTGDRVGTRTVDPVTGAAYTPTGTLGPCAPDGCTATTTSQILCDTAGDGTVTHFVRAVTYDCEGALLATLDRTLDGAPYTVAGTVGVCPTSPDCESPTTPVTSVGLCLADGTPIAVTVVRDCAGATTAEGWINLVTGAWSAGAVPAGAVACGDSQSIQVSGTFCDVDDTTGDVLGLVLVEYTYDEDGAIAAVRLVDAVTGGTYTPTGTVTVCPAGVAQPERDLLQLCDTAADGTVTVFVRDYARDENGAIVGHSDYDLDGAAYTPAGTVGVCAEPCRTTSVLSLCDTTPSGPIELASRLSFTDVDPTPWIIPGGGVIHEPSLVSGQPFWDGGTVTIAPPPGGEAAEPTHRVFAARIGVEGAAGICNPPTDVTLTLNAHIVNLGPNAGQATCGRWHLHNGATIVTSQSALSVSVNGFRDLSITGTVPWADLLAGNVHISMDLETAHFGPKSWTADGFSVTVTPTEVEPCDTSTGEVTPFLRTIVTDCATGETVSSTDTAVDGVTPYTPAGDVAPCCCCGGTSSEACRDTSTVLVCDVPADSSTAISPTFVDGVTADTGQTQFQNHPGPYTALWAGGPFIFPAGAGPTQEHLTATGQVTADLDGCDGAAGTLTISARVRNDGPDDGQAWDGALRLFRGTTLLASHNALEWAPVGWQGTLTVSAPVTAAEVAAGDIRIALTLETYHLGAKAWTVDQFTASLELEGCEVTSSTQFLRTLVTDCETGEVVSTTDTTLDGQPYTVTGEVGQCTPAATTEECRDCEQSVLCDVTEEGATAFLRTVCRDCTGTVVSTLDTGLDGTTPYAPVGTVGSCGPDGCQTTAVQTIRLCDLDPTVEPDEEGRRCAVPFLRHLAYDCAGAILGFHDTGLDGTTPYTPVQVVDCQCETGEGLTSSIEVPWQVVSVVEDPAGVAGQDFIYTVSPETDPSRIGTIHVHVSQPAGGACGPYDINNLVFSNTSAYTLTLDAVAQEMSYLRVDLIDFDTFEPVGINSGMPEPDRLGGTAGWNPAHTRIVPAESNGTGYMYWDNPPAQVGWTVFNQGGGTSCSALSFQGMTVEPGGCCGGTETAGCAECGPVETGVRAVTGTAAQDLVAEFPTLQSVSLAVIAGAVNVTMSDGTDVPIPAGVTLTWSVSKDTDTALAAASFAGADASASYLLNWTHS